MEELISEFPEFITNESFNESLHLKKLKLKISCFQIWKTFGTATSAFGVTTTLSGLAILIFWLWENHLFVTLNVNIMVKKL